MESLVLPNLLETTVGEIARLHPKTMSFFDAAGIDFCCGGKRTLQVACLGKKIDPTSFAVELNAFLAQPADEYDLNAITSLPLDQLAAHIVEKHHEYVQKQTAELLRLCAKVSRVHGGEHPELHEVNSIFNAVASELASHMKKEELILFPWITRLAAAERGEIPYQYPPFGSLQNPIGMMEQEHVEAGDGFVRIRELTNNYVLPQGGCASYWQMLNYLEAFEKDLHVHIHLENNVLFPAAIKMESVMQSSN